MEFAPSVLPVSMRTLAGGVPAAPPGTLFLLGALGGYSAPSRPYTLFFGRDEDNVHVLVGRGDQHISRRHGEVAFDGQEWRLRNLSRLPIQLPGDSLLLAGCEIVLTGGYLPLFMGASRHRQHLVEIYLAGVSPADDGVTSGSPTVLPTPYELGEVERLVLTALAQRYLRQESRPQPLSWNDVADELNQAPGESGWTAHRAANVVTTLRRQLSAGKNPNRKEPVDGIMRAEGAAEPLGNVINHTLILELLRTTTLAPTDLRLLGGLDD